MLQIILAQALHWFDRPRFYKEVMRVLRPHTGVFAAWMYDAGHINTQGSAEDQAYQHVLHGTLGTYWARARKARCGEGRTGFKQCATSDGLCTVALVSA